jgi:mannose-6-phosphate isomerase-like protein (cupin superfamily)
MSTQSRVPFKLKHPGPYIAIVKNHLDVGYMGGLEVALIKGNVDDTFTTLGQSVQVKYLSPFYGITSISYAQETDPKSFAQTQKSYGMWMVPPDVGTKVMVIFIDGDYNQGYWIGCVPDRYMNHMIPDIAAQELPDTWLTADQIDKYGQGVNTLPVAEYNKKANKDLSSPSTIPRPVHPFADKLADQGLLLDAVRGITSSSARREIPSTVFGISTPGPIDTSDTAPMGELKYGGKATSTAWSRLGGSTFVMDDGDETGNNELVRLRTRTGHQILLHNTADIIYIANGKGTAWIELTGQGKIDIYAQDSVSIHTEADFNFRADRDVNIEAGRNFNLHSFGDMKIEAKNNFSVLAGDTGKISGNTKVVVNSGGTVELFAVGDALITGDNVGLNATTAIKLTAPKIANQDPADPATKADATAADGHTIYNAPFKTGNSSWANRFSAGNISTILQRVPTHEPWDQHENINPDAFASYNLDTTAPNNPDYVPSALPPNSVAAGTDATGSIVFTSGSGDSLHFAQTKPELQAAVTAAAIAFKQKTGKPMVITSSYRSYAEQKRIYNGWLAGGGGPGKPKVYVPGIGNIMTPVNPDGPGFPNAHNRGIGIDSPNCPEMDRLGILSANGLYRPVPGPDPVHAALRNPPPDRSRPTSNQGASSSE